MHDMEKQEKQHRNALDSELTPWLFSALCTGQLMDYSSMRQGLRGKSLFPFAFSCHCNTVEIGLCVDTVGKTSFCFFFFDAATNGQIRFLI